MEVEDKTLGNPGWADAMKKILSINKPKKKKTVVLSKAKKLQEVVSKPKTEVVPFEIETEAGEIKEEALEVKDNVKELEKNEQIKTRRKELGIRQKPSILDREKEKKLQKIATNGVVQLFNAVKKQQKEIEERLNDAGPTENKREKAMKSINRKAFLDVLMGGTNNLSADTDSPEEIKQDTISNKNENKVWSVLRDDFVMGAKLKDWNKDDTDGEESSAAEEMDSD